MTHKTTILNKISDNTIVVGIIGLGYVGLPASVTYRVGEVASERSCEMHQHH